MAFIFRAFFFSVSDGDESQDLIGYVSRQLVVVRYFPPERYATAIFYLNSSGHPFGLGLIKA